MKKDDHQWHILVLPTKKTIFFVGGFRRETNHKKDGLTHL
jgi:hypothetical protein